MSKIFIRNNVIDTECYKLTLPLKHTLILSAIGDFDVDNNGNAIGSKISNGELAFLLRTNKYEVSRCLAWLHKNEYIDFYGKAQQRQIRRGARYYQEIYGLSEEERHNIKSITKIINPSCILRLIDAQRGKGWY